MRGAYESGGSLFSDVDLGQRIPARNTLWTFRQVAKDAPASLGGACRRLCAAGCRSLSAAVRLIGASLIGASLIHIVLLIRPARHLIQRMRDNLLFRCGATPTRIDPKPHRGGLWLAEDHRGQGTGRQSQIRARPITLDPDTGRANDCIRQRHRATGPAHRLIQRRFQGPVRPDIQQEA